MYSVWAPFIAGALLIKRLTFELRLLVLLVMCKLVLELLANYLGSHGIHNLFLSHIYSYIEFSLMATIFYRLARIHTWKMFILISSIGFIIFSIINLIYFESFEEFNSNQRYLEGILIFVFCVGYFFKLIKKAEHVFLERHPYFILAASYLFYISGTLFLFLSSKNFMGADLHKYWEMHGLMNIWLNLSFVAVFWKGQIKLGKN